MDSNLDSVNSNPLAANSHEQRSRANESVARTQAALTQTHHRLEQTRALLTRQRRRLLLLHLRDQRCFERALHLQEAERLRRSRCVPEPSSDETDGTMREGVQP